MSWTREAFEHRLFGRGFQKAIGMTLEHVEDGLCRARLPYRPEFSPDDGLVHGGIIATLIDNVGAGAVWSHRAIDWSRAGVTINLTANFLKAANKCDLVAEGRTVRFGGALSVADVRVHSAEGDLIATGTVTYMLMPTGRTRAKMGRPSRPSASAEGA